MVLKNEKGVVLFVVLLIMTVVMILGTAFLYAMRTEGIQVIRYEQKTQAYYYARSGAEAALEWLELETFLDPAGYNGVAYLAGNLTQLDIFSETPPSTYPIVVKISAINEGQALLIESSGTEQGKVEKTSVTLAIVAGQSESPPLDVALYAAREGTELEPAIKLEGSAKINGLTGTSTMGSQSIQLDWSTRIEQLMIPPGTTIDDLIKTPVKVANRDSPNPDPSLDPWTQVPAPWQHITVGVENMTEVRYYPDPVIPEIPEFTFELSMPSPMPPPQLYQAHTEVRDANYELTGTATISGNFLYLPNATKVTIRSNSIVSAGIYAPNAKEVVLDSSSQIQGFLYAPEMEKLSMVSRSQIVGNIHGPRLTTISLSSNVKIGGDLYLPLLSTPLTLTSDSLIEGNIYCPQLSAFNTSNASIVKGDLYLANAMGIELGGANTIEGHVYAPKATTFKTGTNDQILKTVYLPMATTVNLGYISKIEGTLYAPLAKLTTNYCKIIGNVYISEGEVVGTSVNGSLYSLNPEGELKIRNGNGSDGYTTRYVIAGKKLSISGSGSKIKGEVYASNPQASIHIDGSGTLDVGHLISVGTLVDIQGGGYVKGVIYSPNAYVNTNTHVVGTVVANSIRVTGSAIITYDETIANTFPTDVLSGGEGGGGSTPTLDYSSRRWR